jgi:hypothetical protein
VGNNGSIAPGNSGIGTLTLNSTLTLAASSVMRMEINPANGQNADLLVASSVPLNGTLEVVNVGPTPQLGDTFNLIDGTISGSFAGMNLPKLAPPLIWDDSQLGTSGVLTVGSNSLPVLPFEITDLQVPPGSLEVTWNSYPGQVYDLEYSFDAFSWQDLANNIPADPVTNHTSQSVSTVGGGVGFDVLLAQYQMTSTNAEIQDPVNLVGSGPLTQGAGISYFAVPASLGYPTDPVLQVNQSGTSPDLASSIANQAWFTFDITVGSSVTDLDLTSLTFLGARGGGATPRGYGVLVTTPTTTDEQVGGPTDFTTQRPTMTLQDIDLSGVASLQNLTAGQVITFKIAYYSPSNGNSGEFDNITVSGNITPGPDPVYGGADQLFIRASQQ